jgi:hypothetical protein
MAQGLAALDVPEPTKSEYRTACRFLEKHRWKMYHAFETGPDPELTGRIRDISGALTEGIKGINEIHERRGYSSCTLRHFCEGLELW